VIIFRYLAKEVYTTLLVITGILLLTFMSNAFVRYLTRAASGKLSGGMVLKIIAIQVPTLVGLLLPVGLFLAFLLVYGRLYAESEMTVLTACGMSRFQLLQRSLWISLLIILLDVVFVFSLSPKLAAYQHDLLLASAEETMIQTIQPGRFQVANKGSDVFYIESVNRKGDKLKNIFVAQKKKAKAGDDKAVWNVLSAESGYSYRDVKTDQSYVIAQKGYRYFGVPGQKDFKIMRFSEYGARIEGASKTSSDDEATLPTSRLWRESYHNLKAMAELQWRISIPLSIPILTLLAVPLSRVKPREGRYAQLLPAILIYAIYANMMFVAKSWIVHGKISPIVGMGWLHVLLLFVALGYWFNLRYWRRLFRRQRGETRS
jgi:lipopolysaccharide export system permease protein